MIQRIWNIGILLALWAPVTSAHGVDQSLQGEVGQAYMVDIDYDRLGLRPQEEVTFKFNIYDVAKKPKALMYDRVEVTVSDAQKPLVKGIIAYDQNATGWKYTFPRNGRYTLKADFMFDDNHTVSRSFSVDVHSYSGVADRILENLHYVIAAILGLFALYVIAQSLRKNPDGIIHEEWSKDDQ